MAWNNAGNIRGLVRTRAELEAAIAAGGTIFVDERNEIVISGTHIDIATSRPVHIIGGRFKFDTNSTHGFYVSQSDVTFDGCTFTGIGTATGTYVNNRRFVYASGTDTNNLLSNINVLNCTMTGSIETNIFYRYVKDSNIRGNRIRDYLYGGVMLLSCTGIMIDGNTIDDAVMRAPVVNTYGIAITDGANLVEARSRDITVSNNILRNHPWEAIDTHGGERITITGNIIINAVRGIALVVGNDDRLVVPNFCVVTGNFVDGKGSDREGISLFGLANNPADALITGNKVQNFSINIYVGIFNRANTYIGGNNVPWVPWTNLTMTGGWNAHPTIPPQYHIDGKTVSLRGMVQPPGGTKQSLVAKVPSGYAPDALIFLGTSKGSNAAAGNVVFGMNPDGSLSSYYGSGTDTYYYPLHGSYEMI